MHDPSACETSCFPFLLNPEKQCIERKAMCGDGGGMTWYLPVSNPKFDDADSPVFGVILGVPFVGMSNIKFRGSIVTCMIW